MCGSNFYGSDVTTVDNNLGEKIGKKWANFFYKLTFLKRVFFKSSGNHIVVPSFCCNKLRSLP
jgi:hypothetical protein